MSTAEVIVNDERAESLKDLLREVQDFDWTVRTANCLDNLNVRFVGDLVQMTEAQLLKAKNFGRKSLKEVKEALAQLPDPWGSGSLQLGMKIEDWETLRPSTEVDDLKQSYEAELKRLRTSISQAREEAPRLIAIAQAAAVKKERETVLGFIGQVIAKEEVGLLTAIREVGASEKASPAHEAAVHFHMSRVMVLRYVSVQIAKGQG